MVNTEVTECGYILVTFVVILVTLYSLLVQSYLSGYKLHVLLVSLVIILYLLLWHPVSLYFSVFCRYLIINSYILLF